MIKDSTRFYGTGLFRKKNFSRLLLTVFFSLAFTLQLVAQTRTVTGRVTAGTGEGLAGASVSVKGSTAGTTTDASGNFTLSVPENATLVVSYVGYQSREVAVGSETNLAIGLDPVASQLEQVVVIGYGTANRRDLTGSIATIKGREIADKPNANPISSLQGRVAGVQIINNGRPGAEPDIRIRGTNSINNVRPLYVVDGIFNDNINFINPADIESIEILKDPSSLAIFGVRGANGVVIVTTKRARAGQTLVNFNSSIGIKRVTNRIELTDAAEFKMLFEEQLKNEAEDAGRPYVPFDYAQWQANTDWQDQIFQDAVLAYNNISITSGSAKNKFYAGLGYVSEEGIIKHERLQKFTVNLNDEVQISKPLKFGFGFNGYRARLPQSRSVGGAISALPIAEPFNEQYGLYSTLPSLQRAQVWNPLVDVELRKKTAIDHEYRAVGNIFGQVDFLRFFNFRAGFFADYGFNTGRGYSPIITVYNPDLGSARNPFVDSLVRQTSVYQNQNVHTKVQQDYLLTFKNNFGEHNLTALAGLTSYYRAFEGTSASIQQGTGDPIMNESRFWYVNAGGGIGDPSTRVGSGSAWEAATLSYLFRTLYNYSNKYLVNLSFRRDGSSAFPKENRWDNFGSIGVGWLISDESFMDNQNFLNYLKLKGSWGVLGNQLTDENNRYPYFPVLTGSNSGVFGNNVIPSLTPSYIPQEDLGWETVRAFETGVELRTLKNRLFFEANYYNRLTKGILVQVPGQLGTSPGLFNAGEATNKGFEFSTVWNGTAGNDLSYTISGNFTTINNEVKSLYNEGFAIVQGPSRTTAGYPIGYFYGYVHDGIYQTFGEILKSPQSALGDPRPGDIKFRDINGDGIIDTDDRTVIGNPTPDFTYGASFSVNFKGLDFGVDVMGVYGNEIFRDWNRGNFAILNYSTDRLARWNGVGTSNWEPMLNTGRNNNYLISSYYIEDGSFFRIRNVQLGYNVPAGALNRIHLKNLRVYLNAQNLATFANNTGFTPEFGGSATSFGIDAGSYPVPAIYTFGINLNF